MWNSSSCFLQIEQILVSLSLQSPYSHLPHSSSSLICHTYSYTLLIPKFLFREWYIILHNHYSLCLLTDISMHALLDLTHLPPITSTSTSISLSEVFPFLFVLTSSFTEVPFATAPGTPITSLKNVMNISHNLPFSFDPKILPLSLFLILSMIILLQ